MLMPRLWFHRPCLLLAALMSLSGCGPGVSQAELGKVEFKIPRVDGADEPYVMPELEGLPVEKQTGEPKLESVTTP